MKNASRLIASLAVSAILSTVGRASTGTEFCFGDGSGTACPCLNTSAAGDNVGCTNSLVPPGAVGGRLRADGTPSIGSDSLVLVGDHLTNSFCVYMQGNVAIGGGNGLPWFDGLRCVNVGLIRLAVKTNSLHASQFPEAGDVSVSVRGQISGPSTRYYQVWYRDTAGPCGRGSNFTNGVAIDWTM